jgi:hypothetical protein
MDPGLDPTPDPTPLFIDFKEAKKMLSNFFLKLITYRHAIYNLKILFFAKSLC